MQRIVPLGVAFLSGWAAGYVVAGKMLKYYGAEKQAVAVFDLIKQRQAAARAAAHGPREMSKLSHPSSSGWTMHSGPVRPA